MQEWQKKLGFKTEAQPETVVTRPIQRHLLQWQLIDSDNDKIVTSSDLAILCLQHELEELSYLKTLQPSQVANIAMDVAYAAGKVISFYFSNNASTTEKEITLYPEFLQSGAGAYPAWFNPEYILRAIEAEIHHDKKDTSLDALQKLSQKIARPVPASYFDRKMAITGDIAEAIQHGLDDARILRIKSATNSFKAEIPAATLARILTTELAATDDPLFYNSIYSQELWQVGTNILPYPVKPFKFEIHQPDADSDKERLPVFRINLDTDKMKPALVKEAEEVVRAALANNEKSSFYRQENAFGIEAASYTELHNTLRGIKGLMVDICPDLAKEYKRADLAIRRQSEGRQ